MGARGSALTSRREPIDRPDNAPPDVEDRAHARFLWTIAGLAVAVLWIRPIASSLWTDELGTWWVISGTARQAVQRAEAVQGQSPLSYLLAWLARHVTGTSEIGLRTPALICCLAAAYLLYRIAARLVDAETGRIAVVVFALWPSIAFAASDARPYPLAILASIASVWALIRWVDAPSVRRAVAYVVLAALVPWVHPLFGLVLIPEAVYAVMRIRDGSTTIRPRTFVVTEILIAALIVPVGLEILALWGRHDDWLIPNPLTVPWITQMLVPPALVGAAVIGGIIVGPRLRIGSEARRLPASTITLLITWFVVPAGVLVGIAILTPVRLIMARYLLCAVPGGVLLTAVALRSIDPPRPRRIVILVFAILAIVDFASPWKSGDMRGAAAAVRTVADDDTIVLIDGRFQESMEPSWYTDPERQGLLTAATSFYPVPGRVVPLPVNLTTDDIDFFRSRVDTALVGADHAVVVGETGSSYWPWFDEYMSEHGWSSTPVATMSLFSVVEYRRDG
jgi:mannosyltransferase